MPALLGASDGVGGGTAVVVVDVDEVDNDTAIVSSS